jgi:hypothetical protein
VGKATTGIRIDLAGGRVSLRLLSKSPRGTQYTVKEVHRAVGKASKVDTKKAVSELMVELLAGS